MPPHALHHSPCIQQPSDPVSVRSPNLNLRALLTGGGGCGFSGRRISRSSALLAFSGSEFTPGTEIADVPWEAVKPCGVFQRDPKSSRSGALSISHGDTFATLCSVRHKPQEQAALHVFTTHVELQSSSCQLFAAVYPRPNTFAAMDFRTMAAMSLGCA